MSSAHRRCAPWAKKVSEVDASAPQWMGFLHVEDPVEGAMNPSMCAEYEALAQHPTWMQSYPHFSKRYKRFLGEIDASCVRLKEQSSTSASKIDGEL